MSHRPVDPVLQPGENLVDALLMCRRMDREKMPSIRIYVLSDHKFISGLIHPGTHYYPFLPTILDVCDQNHPQIVMMRAIMHAGQDEGWSSIMVLAGEAYWYDPEGRKRVFYRPFHHVVEGVCMSGAHHTAMVRIADELVNKLWMPAKR